MQILLKLKDEEFRHIKLIDQEEKFATYAPMIKKEERLI